jgi:ribosomal protein S18 acetylase RimI-like enzyme
LISRESLAERVPVTLEPLQTSDAHSYWRTFVAGRTDLPTRDLKVHLDRYLALSPEDQRSHFSVKRDGQIIGTLRLAPTEISGFSMEPTFAGETAVTLLKAVDLLRAGGAATITGQFEDVYEPAFASLGFRRLFARMRMEAPTRRSAAAANIKMQPPEEAEVLGLTTFLMDVYEGHMEQQHGIHVGPEEEWRGYVAGLFKGDSGEYMPDASYVALEGSRIIGAILVTHWMGTPLVAELGVAKDRRGKGIGRDLLQASMHRLAARDEPRLALYVTVGNDPAIALYRKIGFVQVGGQSVTARLDG